MLRIFKSLNGFNYSIKYENKNFGYIIPQVSNEKSIYDNTIIVFILFVMHGVRLLKLE